MWYAKGLQNVYLESHQPKVFPFRDDVQVYLAPKRHLHPAQVCCSSPAGGSLVVARDVSGAETVVLLEVKKARRPALLSLALLSPKLLHLVVSPHATHPRLRCHRQTPEMRV